MSNTPQPPNTSFDLDIQELDRRLEFIVSCSSPNTCTSVDSGTANTDNSTGNSAENDPSAPAGATGQTVWGRPTVTTTITW